MFMWQTSLKFTVCYVMSADWIEQQFYTVILKKIDFHDCHLLLRLHFIMIENSLQIK